MAYSQADLDALQGNIAKGVTTAMIQGEMVVFRNLAEMERIERKIIAAIAPASASSSRLIQPKTSTGWR